MQRFHIWLIESFHCQQVKIQALTLFTAVVYRTAQNASGFNFQYNIHISEVIHYFGWSGFWLPLPSFSFSLRSVCPPTQQMAKVKHISVLWCTSLCTPSKWQCCQCLTLFHPVSQMSVMLWRHLHDLQVQFITSRKEILEILGRFFLPSTMHFTLCATGSVCV